MEATSTQLVLTTEEIASIYKVAKGTLRYWRSVGIGPQYHRIGKKVLYDAATFRSWFDSHKVSPSVLAIVEEKRGSIQAR